MLILLTLFKEHKLPPEIRARQQLEFERVALQWLHDIKVHHFKTHTIDLRSLLGVSYQHNYSLVTYEKAGAYNLVGDVSTWINSDITKLGISFVIDAFKLSHLKFYILEVVLLLFTVCIQILIYFGIKRIYLIQSIFYTIIIAIKVYIWTIWSVVGHRTIYIFNNMLIFNHLIILFQAIILTAALLCVIFLVIKESEKPSDQYYLYHLALSLILFTFMANNIMLSFIFLNLIIQIISYLIVISNPALLDYELSVLIPLGIVLGIAITLSMFTSINSNQSTDVWHDIWARSFWFKATHEKNLNWYDVYYAKWQVWYPTEKEWKAFVRGTSWKGRDYALDNLAVREWQKLKFHLDTTALPLMALVFVGAWCSAILTTERDIDDDSRTTAVTGYTYLFVSTLVYLGAGLICVYYAIHWGRGYLYVTGRVYWGMGLALYIVASVGAVCCLNLYTWINISNMLFLAQIGIGLSVIEDLSCTVLAILCLISRTLITFAFIVYINSLTVELGWWDYRYIRSYAEMKALENVYTTTEMPFYYFWEFAYIMMFKVRRKWLFWIFIMCYGGIIPIGWSLKLLFFSALMTYKFYVTATILAVCAFIVLLSYLADILDFVSLKREMDDRDIRVVRKNSKLEFYAVTLLLVSILFEIWALFWLDDIILYARNFL